MAKFRYILEGSLLTGWFTLCRMLPLDAASALGGFVARCAGPCMGVHKVALQNIARAFPELDAKARLRMVDGMWNNLGRVAGEFAFLPGNKLTSRVACEGLEHLPKDGTPVIFISGHIGNWELSYTIAHNNHVPVALIYRHANNPKAEELITAMRAPYASSFIQKGPRGAFALAKALRKKLSLAMLVDQKMNDGIPVPFFGRPAMTAPAVAEFALRFGLPIIPARIIRGKGAQFRGIVYPPLTYTVTGDKEKDVYAIMLQINQLLESWVREYPEQWFWVHRRWPKD